MRSDKTGFYTFTGIATINALVALFSAGITSNGVAAVTFALLAIAWRPQP
jgi:hypothetical protein